MGLELELVADIYYLVCCYNNMLRQANSLSGSMLIF